MYIGQVYVDLSYKFFDGREEKYYMLVDRNIDEKNFRKRLGNLVNETQRRTLRYIKCSSKEKGLKFPKKGGSIIVL